MKAFCLGLCFLYFSLYLLYFNYLWSVCPLPSCTHTHECMVHMKMLYFLFCALFHWHRPHSRYSIKNGYMNDEITSLLKQTALSE